jgi:hypothetical protein
MNVLRAFHVGTIDLDSINRSYITLLPKKPDDLAVGDYRSICLQNYNIKLLSKILTNRLKPIIGSLVILDQTGFLKGRSISEYFIYALELIQCYHKQKTPTLVLKLDFAKAFDTVNWVILFKILAARGFSDHWMMWVEKNSRLLKNLYPCECGPRPMVLL